SDEFTGSNGAWAWHFSLEAKMCSGNNDDMDKRVSVKHKHLTGSLDLLYALEEFNIQHMLSKGLSVDDVLYKPRSKQPTLKKTDDTSLKNSFTNDDFRTPIGSEHDSNDSDENDDSDESDEECVLRLNVEEIGFDEYIDQGDKHLATGDPSWAKQPDMIGNIVNNGMFAYEVMFGEVTGEVGIIYEGLARYYSTKN
ncbi:7003_t:CDS:2, partial [Entrophospora sp. SA101]